MSFQNIVRVPTLPAGTDLEPLMRIVWHDEFKVEMTYDRETGRLWVWVAQMSVADDGRIVCHLPSYLRDPEFEGPYQVALGHAELAWNRPPSEASGWMRVEGTDTRCGKYRTDVWAIVAEGEVYEKFNAALAPMRPSRERLDLLESLEEAA